jgi:hypothetical protein
MFKYPGAQHLDSQLIDVSDLAAVVGFKVPVALTAGLHSRLGASPGRLYHLLNKLFWAIRGSKINRIDAGVHFPDGPIAFYAISSRGANGNLSVTVMLSNES